MVSLFLGVGIVGVSFGFLAQGSSDYDSVQAFSEEAEEDFDFVWTKLGLEQIPFDSWRDFSGNATASSLFIKDLPFPGEDFTASHLDAWNANVEDDANIEDLLEAGYVLHGFEHQEAVAVFEDYSKIPSTYADPIFMEESLIDYRLQFAADIGSTMIGDTAAKGRLVSPAGRRLREHFYRFPDQCDATPIALEVFLRLMIYDQIEAFFDDSKIGLWHDLFSEVERRPYDSEELSVARWYGERYAEGYVHKITNGWVYPLSKQNIDTYMLAVGLDPYDMTEDPSLPAGLGNLIGRKVTEWLAANDGLMKDKDFVDEAGLERIADYHPSPQWNNWKPSLAGSNRFQGIRNGIVTQQTFVSPSLGIFSFLYENEQDYIDLGLQDAVPVLDMSEEAYIARSKEFLELQKTMTDREKAVAELSNNKISGSIFLIIAFKPLLKQLASDEEYARLYDEFSMVTSGCAEYAATHAAWRHKRTYLAGRPKTIIRHLAKVNQSFAAEYPEAADFEPMIPAGDHPEYPSGSSAIYSAFAQAADDWFLEKFGYAEASKNTGKVTFTIPADGFYWLDGPSEDIVLEYDNLNDWIEELPKSRVYGGVHFMEAGNAGVALGKKVGNACSRMLSRLNAGDMEATYPFAGRESINAFNPPPAPVV